MVVLKDGEARRPIHDGEEVDVLVLFEVGGSVRGSHVAWRGSGDLHSPCRPGPKPLGASEGKRPMAGGGARMGAPLVLPSHLVPLSFHSPLLTDETCWWT